MEKYLLELGIKFRRKSKMKIKKIGTFTYAEQTFLNKIKKILGF